ncbi:MAG: hypothetical protein NTW19_01015 [Planctomycetota bacterium]|nr:hypothetical protein [Planctomycetota bacterium]
MIPTVATLIPASLASLPVFSPVLAEDLAPLAPAGQAWIVIVSSLALTAGVILVSIMGSKRGKRD